MPLPRILLVDDEPNVLVGVTRVLHGKFDCVAAISGEEALQHLTSGAFDAVVTDMRMPKMDGATFLAQARRFAPDTMRLVMSGHSDLEAAVRAMNEGQIFRFLLKPVPRDQLVQALDAALEQRRLLQVERELLERTLTGAIDALTETLAMHSPIAYGRSLRLRRISRALATELKVARIWPLEVAAMLSQFGISTLPPDTVERYYNGVELSDVERTMVDKAGDAAIQLLRHIPRLEPVIELLSSLDADNVPSLESHILRTASKLEHSVAHGEDASSAIEALRASATALEKPVIDACVALNALLFGQGPQRGVTLTRLQPGMVLVADVRSRAGALLISRGHEVSDAMIIRLRNFAATVGIREPIQVTVPPSWVENE